MSILEQVRQHRIVTALRGVPAEKAADVAHALYEGGIRLVEVTFNQSDAARLAETARVIRAVKKQMGDKMAVGAGTVLTVEEAEAAAEAGAAFLLSPNTDEKVIFRGKQLGLGMIPGAFTPTEIAAAYQAGADLVKVFPVGNLGPDYLKAVKAPLSQIPLLAMGGIDLKNLTAFLSVAEGVGIGANIANLQLIREGRFQELTALAKEYTRLLWLEGKDEGLI